MMSMQPFIHSRLTRVSIPALAFLCFLILTPTSFAGLSLTEPSPTLVQISSETSRVLIDPYLEILKDTDRQYSITDVASDDLANRFTQNEDAVFNPGFDESGYWLKFSVHLNNSDDGQASSVRLLEFDNTMLDTILLYERKPNGQFILRRGGDLIPLDEKEFAFSTSVFQIMLRPKQTKTFYAYISTSTSNLGVSIVLWKAKAFINHQTTKRLVIGIFYGVVFSMLIYNLFLYFSISDKSYLYYIGMIFFLGLYRSLLDGYAYQYLWPNYPEVGSYMISPIFFFMCISPLVFTRSFLDSENTIPQYDKLLRGVIVCYTVFFAISGFIDFSSYAKVQGVFSLFIPPFLIVCGVKAWQAGYQVARWFLIAWIFFTTGMIIHIFDLLGYSSENFVLKYAMQIGHIFEVTLLSLALADRINFHKKQNHELQEAALTAQENARQYSERIVESMQDLLFVIDAKGIIKQANSSVCQTLRMDKADIEGQSIFSFISDLSTVSVSNSMINEVFLKQALSKSFIQEKCILTTAREQRIPVALFCSVIPDRELKNKKIVCVMHDLRFK